MTVPQKYTIAKDIRVACLRASSFPGGIGEAWQKLFSVLPDAQQRRLYGISYGGEGKIIYMAATEEKHEGEAEELGLDPFVISSGEYVSEVLEDWRKDETQIAKIFQKLLRDPHIDKEKGYCLEIYFNEGNVRCAVLLAAEYQGS